MTARHAGVGAADAPAMRMAVVPTLNVCRKPPRYVPYKGTFVPYGGTYGAPDQGQTLDV